MDSAQLTRNILTSIPAGMLLLGRTNTILMANRRACDMLEMSEDQLLHQPLHSLFIDPPDAGDGSEWIGHEMATAFFRRGGAGAPFPVTFESSTLALPAAVFPDLVARDGQLETYVFVFTDITHLIELQKQIKEAEELKAASSVAAKLAHQIRTPLTSILAASQMLQSFDAMGETQKLEARQRVLKEKEQLFAELAMESARLDKVLQEFLDHAEFSTSDLVHLMDLDAAQAAEPEP